MTHTGTSRPGTSRPGRPTGGLPARHKKRQEGALVCPWARDSPKQTQAHSQEAPAGARRLFLGVACAFLGSPGVLLGYSAPLGLPGVPWPVLCSSARLVLLSLPSWCCSIQSPDIPRLVRYTSMPSFPGGPWLPWCPSAFNATVQPLDFPDVRPQARLVVLSYSYTRWH